MINDGCPTVSEVPGDESIFGLPGEENIDVMDALLDRTIKFVTTHHEQGAAFMADVYVRLTGRAGVCLSTLGPDAANLIDSRVEVMRAIGSTGD